MNKSRIEAFSDGVIAIIITIMVLELKAPQGTQLADLYPLRSIVLCYFLSFLYLAIYWNNHHHLFQTVTKINGKILWANIHLLFWLSFIPFATAWAGQNHFASIPTAFYGFVFLMAGCAYLLLTKILIREEGADSVLAKAVGNDVKEKISIFFYAIAILIALWFPYIALSIYLLVAVFWFVPDTRIEKKLNQV